MKIKICGIQNFNDVEIMNRHLPDAVGFIFYNKSKRYIEPCGAKKLCEKLDRKILKAGVFVNSGYHEIVNIVKECELDIVQLHGDEDNKCIQNIKEKCLCEVWKAIRIENEASVEKMQGITPDRFLLDTYVKEYGGEGKTFNWDILKNIDTSKIILAGGINEVNIRKAIYTVKPYMVDVSQGASENGVKDERKVKKLIEAVRKYE